MINKYFWSSLSNYLQASVSVRQKEKEMGNYVIGLVKNSTTLQSFQFRFFWKKTIELSQYYTSNAVKNNNYTVLTIHFRDIK